MNKFQRWPPLNCLKGFEAAARLASFSRAAEELNMTQSAVSHQIKTLEEYLGLDLFLRANRKVILSDAGRELLKTTEAGMEIFASGLNRIEQYKKPNQLIVHTDTALASNWLVPRLEGFKTSQPDADLWLYTTDGDPDLYMDEVHLAVLYGDGKWPGIETDKLVDDVLAPLCAPNHPIMGQMVRNPIDLENFALLHGEQKETWHTWFSDNDLPNINPVSGSNFSNPSLMLQTAAQGEGIALGSLILSTDALASGDLVSPFSSTISSSMAIYLVHGHENMVSPLIAPFVDWLRGEAEILKEKLGRILGE